MGKVAEKKKKGRPSLLDLQKRSLAQQQLQQHKNNQQNPKPHLQSRSTRRNPNSEGTVGGREEEDEEGSNGKRREKKLKLVLRLPNRSPNSPGSVDGEGDHEEDDDNGETPIKKRKTNAVDVTNELAQKQGVTYPSASKGTDADSEAASESGPMTPLPDKKLLIFILDRLQKKDTYSVFSEPVDTTELPDYLEVIEHPMDFGTVRDKLSYGAYANLEQFEEDIFLICTNAMCYNAPNTIYFRQARAIQELAKKNFENLRQGNEVKEPELKVVRRGRPPGKTSIKRQLGWTAADRAGFSSDATLATPADSRYHFTRDCLRRTDKTGSGDLSARSLHGSRNGETSGCSADHKFCKNEEFLGSMLKGVSKFGKKPFILDENRRSTYKQSLQSVSRHEPSVLVNFDTDRKQLMPIGLHMEHVYARSLARFAAKLGPIAWRVASRKIERSLPPGEKFGPGWVGEKEAPQHPLPPLISSSLQQPIKPSALLMQYVAQTRISSCNTIAQIHELEGNSLLEKQQSSNNSAASEASISRTPPLCATTSSIAEGSASHTDTAETVAGTNLESGFNVLPSGGLGAKPHFLVHQNTQTQSPVNGFNPGFGFILSQTGNMVRSGRPPDNHFGSDTSAPRMTDSVIRRANSSIHQIPGSQSVAEGEKLFGSSTSINSGGSLRDSQESQAGPGLDLHPHQPQEMSPHRKLASVPPDLNVRL